MEVFNYKFALSSIICFIVKMCIALTFRFVEEQMVDMLVESPYATFLICDQRNVFFHVLNVGFKVPETHSLAEYCLHL